MKVSRRSNPMTAGEPLKHFFQSPLFVEFLGWASSTWEHVTVPSARKRENGVAFPASSCHRGSRKKKGSHISRLACD